MLLNATYADFEYASKLCSYFGTLPVIRDENDQIFLQEWLKVRDPMSDNDPIWLGARYIVDSSQVIWQSIPEVKYFNWDKLEPFCPSKTKCCALQMRTNGKWAVRSCEVNARILCKFDTFTANRSKNELISNRLFMLVFIPFTFIVSSKFY